MVNAPEKAAGALLLWEQPSFAHWSTLPLQDGRVRAGEAVATQRIGPSTRLRVVDTILSGTHSLERVTTNY